MKTPKRSKTETKTKSRMSGKSTFYDRAKKYGHSIEAIKAGMTVSSTITVNNVDQLKGIFDEQITDPEHKIGTLLFQGIPVPDDMDGSMRAVLRRVNAFIYEGTELSAADREKIANGFPMQVEFTSSENFEPTAPVIINSPTQPKVYNYGTLTLNQGIYVSVYQTTVTFNIDEVVRNGDNGNPNIGDFNIFGATGTAGPTGSVGSTGGTGSAGSKGTCKSGGGISDKAGGAGGTGITGGTGGPGNPGKDGHPSQQATITINDGITGNVLFFTRSGTGGAGGPGGTGGRGGTGGNGGKGATCGCECTNGGNAGNGGTGGIGGQGGNGGNGVNAAANIVVTIPASVADQVSKNSAYAGFGDFGAGGQPGGGGPAGSKGGGGGASGCPSCSSGSSGSKGGSGSQGGNGNPGTIQGAPATITIIKT